MLGIMDWRGYAKMVPQTKEDFNHLLPNVDLIEIIEAMNESARGEFGRPFVHYVYRISVEGDDNVYSMSIGSGSYGSFEVWNGKKDPIGCDSEEDVLNYIKKCEKSDFGTRADFSDEVVIRKAFEKNEK